MDNNDEQTRIAEINKLHQELQKLATDAVDRAIRLGELLSLAKSRLPHGQWLSWLTNNVAFTDRTARNYMRIFEKRVALKSENVSDLAEAYKLLGDRKSKRAVARQEDGLSSARQRELAQNNKPPRMTREEAERLDAQIVALLREVCDQAPQRFAEMIAYCNSEFRNPDHVQKVLYYADELELFFGPFDVPEQECQCLREYQRQS